MVSFVKSGAFKTDYGWEPHRNLKTQVKNIYAPPPVNPLTILKNDYGYDKLERRTSVVNRGNAYNQPAFDKYGYNNRRELTGSERFVGNDPTQPGIPVDPEKRLYVYDPIGNRRNATEGTAATTYTANSMNQYTSVSGTIPAYDDDGNVTDYKNLKHSWNAENQLISAEPKNPVGGDKKTEYLYDYMGRRVRKQI